MLVDYKHEEKGTDFLVFKDNNMKSNDKTTRGRDFRTK
jgi:hypothetical protein